MIATRMRGRRPAAQIRRLLGLLVLGAPVLVPLGPASAKARIDDRELESTGPTKTTRAIYEVQGKRQFTICFDPQSDKRPNGFGGKGGGRRFRNVWVRSKE